MALFGCQSTELPRDGARCPAGEGSTGIAPAWIQPGENPSALAGELLSANLLVAARRTFKLS